MLKFDLVYMPMSLKICLKVITTAFYCPKEKWYPPRTVSRVLGSVLKLSQGAWIPSSNCPREPGFCPQTVPMSQGSDYNKHCCV